MSFKEKILIRRKIDGTVLPIETEIEIDGVKEKVSILPLPIGIASEFAKYKDENSPEAILAAAKLISQHYVDPSFTIEEAKDLKLAYGKPLIDALLEVSGYEKKN